MSEMGFEGRYFAEESAGDANVDGMVKTGC